MNITWSGVTEFGRSLRAAQALGPQAMISALYQGANRIMTIAKQDYVPVDTGALRASGFVEPPTIGNGIASVTLGFGGPSAPYAMIVHEDLTKRHKVGQAKYLEVPVRAAMQGMLAVLTQRERDVLQQAIQRTARATANLAAGRPENWGQPLFGESDGAA